MADDTSIGQSAELETNEPRLIEETGTDARIAAIIEPILVSMNFRLVRVRLSGQNGMTLQIMAERPDGSMTVQDCEAVSRAISPVLDVEDPVDRAYHLEVSSPGIDRPMVRKSDFQRWLGQLIKCETSILVSDRKRFRGWIKEVNNDGFVVERDQPAIGEPHRVEIPFDALTDAKLILTDQLIDAALKADKERSKAANENAPQSDDNGAQS